MSYTGPRASRATGSAASPALCLRCNKTTTATALFTVLVLAAWLYGGESDPSDGDLWWSTVTAVPDPAPSSDSSSRRRLADGCTHVYLDVGSNIGVQVRKLYEPAKYADAAVLPVFEEEFGPSPARNHRVCAFGFEANPKHAARLKAVEGCYSEHNWRAQFFVPLAVSTRVAQLKLQFEGTADFEFWGASVVPEARGPHGLSQSVMIPSVNFSQFVLDEIAGRKIPAEDLAAGITPRVLMKLDIEGSEYEVLPALMETGALCHINTIFLEWHPRVATPETLAATEPVKAWLAGTASDQAARCKPPSISTVDDETYLHDGQPAPTGANCTAIPNTG